MANKAGEHMGTNNETVHKSFRVSKALDNRVYTFREPADTDARLYRRVIEAGCDALEANREKQRYEQGKRNSRTQPNNDENTSAQYEGSTVAELREHVATLKQVNASLLEQLKVKDGQIAEAQKLADQAQKLTGRAQELHAMSAEPARVIEETTTENEGEEPVKTSWWRRLWD